MCGKWSDIVDLYQAEKDHIVRCTRFTHEACHPTGLQKNKVSLALQVFNEKVVSTLKMDGKIDTANFVENIVHFWKVVNCSNPKESRLRHDSQNQPINSEQHPSIDFLESLVDSFSKMGSGKGKSRKKTLTSEIEAAITHTLRGIVS